MLTDFQNSFTVGLSSEHVNDLTASRMHSYTTSWKAKVGKLPIWNRCIV